MAMLKITGGAKGTFLVFIYLVIVMCFTARMSMGQVTFSRDWTAGKRSISDEGNCLANAKSTAALCHMLMNELRKLSACEGRAMVQLLRNQNDMQTSDQAIFSGGR